uniref:Uncharacterized protein n=1 Tax=Craspedostauros australis TaxID=1486917 RepID=A0A6T6GGG3_9STRA
MLVGWSVGAHLSSCQTDLQLSMKSASSSTDVIAAFLPTQLVCYHAHILVLPSMRAQTQAQHEDDYGMLETHLLLVPPMGLLPNFQSDFWRWGQRWGSPCPPWLIGRAPQSSRPDHALAFVSWSWNVCCLLCSSCYLLHFNDTQSSQ